MASACGIIGYQALTYYFYGNWPAVSFHYVFEELFGDFPILEWRWENDLLAFVGKLPISLVAIVLSYMLLLLSDMLRGHAGRQSP